MFEIGNYVVTANNGICQIHGIETKDMGTGEKAYYILVPIKESTAKVYLPVDLAEKRMRLVMNADDAWKLIKEIKAVDEALVENEKEREKIYKEAINSRDPKRLISIMKTLYMRSQKRLEEGKKTTTIDERYFKLAENQLYSELAFVLRVQKSELNRIIEQNIE